MATPSSSPSGNLTPAHSGLNSRLRNSIIAIVAIVLTVALWLGLRTQTTAVSLATVYERSTPLEVALSNQKPTLMEFYADWCTSCQLMASDLAHLEQQYGDRVNFVMLNVDNNKWLPEILHYRVDGIPHFVFLNAGGDTIASSIGEQPAPVLAADLEALIADAPLPYGQTPGQTSAFSTPLNAKGGDSPRGHSRQG